MAVVDNSSKEQQSLSVEQYDDTGFSFEHQSVLLPGPERIRVAHGTENGTKLLESAFKISKKTVTELFKRGLSRSGNRNCLGTICNGSVQWLCYNDVRKKAASIAKALSQFGLTKGEKVVIFSLNRAEWDITNLGCLFGNHVTVPLYDSLGEDGFKFVLNQCEAKIAFCGDKSKAAPIIAAKQSGASISHVVFFEEFDDKTSQSLKEAEITCESFDNFLAKGDEKFGLATIQQDEAKEDDVATIIYTSGTTGNPKGVVLTHKGWVASISAGYSVVTYGKYGAELNTSSVMFSYLPSAHSLNLAATYIMFAVGGSVVYYSRDVSRLMEDLKVAKPSVLPIVPRLLNRIHSKIQETARKSTLKRKLLHMAISDKLKRIESRTSTPNYLFELTVLRKIQKNMGGNVKVVMTGSAPISKEVMDFTRAAFGCPIIEAYGQSESFAGITATIPGDVQTGHIGPPLKTLMIKLASVEEMGYKTETDEGEICYKGTNVMREYFKNPEETNATVDSDGWLHSGDIGRWLPNGTLKIIDRKKNLFKLSQGEYISAEKVENVYIMSELVNNIFVHGDSLQDFLVAVVDINDDAVRRLIKDNQTSDKGDVKEFTRSSLNNPDNVDLKKVILSDLQKFVKAKGLSSLEVVKNIHIAEVPFSVENNMLTPTMKLKRFHITKTFANELNFLYQQGPIFLSKAK
ncbi:long-chain-fatty-acid--CoA ligase 5-like isoform X2 [Convolutriloba macropyga]